VLLAAQLGQLEAALLGSAAGRSGRSAAGLSSRSAGRGSGTGRSAGGGRSGASRSSRRAARRLAALLTVEPARFRGDAGKQNQHGGSQRCPLHYKHLLKTGVVGNREGRRASKPACHRQDARRHRSPSAPRREITSRFRPPDFTTLTAISAGHESFANRCRSCRACRFSDAAILGLIATVSRTVTFGTSSVAACRRPRQTRYSADR